MKTRKRINFTPQEREDLWDRWRSGESLSTIGKALQRHAATIYSVILQTGGFSPCIQKRSIRHLSLSEREEISRGICQGLSIRNIAKQLDRSPSTISREIKRNGGIEKYRATHADDIAYVKAKRPKICKLKKNEELCSLVAQKLKIDWSPEQISGWLKNNFAGIDTMQISHETIYRSLYVQTRGVLKKELLKHLRTKRTVRQSRHFNSKGSPRGQIKDLVSIQERPKEVEDRGVPGHWEGDLICGSANTHIATLVERQSRFTMLIKLPGKDSNSVISSLTREVKSLPGKLKQTLTWDRGPEMAEHKQFTIDTDIKVYFCDPRSPWQRGSNENTNRLLRQYLPKKTNLAKFSQDELNEIASKLNSRPRKILQFSTPSDKFQGMLQ